MSLITIKTFDNAIQAHMLKSKLESEGIICFLFDENIVGIHPLYNITVGGIKLKVRNQDVERVTQILNEIELATGEGVYDIICPNCSSKNIVSEYDSEGGFKAKLHFIVSVFLMAWPFTNQLAYYCRTCKSTFSGLPMK